MNLCILLTATIHPQGIGILHESEREAMYINTLLYYAKTLGRSINIIFAENSGYSLEHIKGKVDNQLNIEYLSFNPDEFVIPKGKGYNEMLMMDKVMQISSFIKKSTHFLKITGRYPIINIKNILKEIYSRCNNETKYMGDMKDTDLFLKLRYGECRFWVCKIDYYLKTFQGRYVEIDDVETGKCAEDFFLRHSRKHRGEKNYIFRFHTQVFFGSSDSASVRNTFASTIKNNIRTLMRRLFPKWWF